MNPEYPIFSTTLCYLERDDAYLMLHRVKKEDDYNHDKWVGVGGKFERFESPEDCLLREVKEETGLTLTHWRSRGLLTFIWGNMTEFIHLYTADGWTGERIQGDACREGVLEWVPKERVEQLPIWEGDKIFFKLLNEEHPWFSLKLVYEGDVLRQAVLDGKEWYKQEKPAVGRLFLYAQFSFRSPSWIQPSLRSISQKRTLSTAGRTKQMRTRAAQSIGVIAALVPAAMSLTQPV